MGRGRSRCWASGDSVARGCEDARMETTRATLATVVSSSTGHPPYCSLTMRMRCDAMRAKGRGRPRAHAIAAHLWIALTGSSTLVVRYYSFLGYACTNTPEVSKTSFELSCELDLDMIRKATSIFESSSWPGMQTSAVRYEERGTTPTTRFFSSPPPPPPRRPPPQRRQIVDVTEQGRRGGPLSLSRGPETAIEGADRLAGNADCALPRPLQRLERFQGPGRVTEKGLEAAGCRLVLQRSNSIACLAAGANWHLLYGIPCHVSCVLNPIRPSMRPQGNHRWRRQEVVA